MMLLRTVLLAASLALCAAGSPAQSKRSPQKVSLGHLLKVHEIRPNTLEGKGLVTGLKSTGDGGAVTRQALTAYLTRSNLRVRADQVAAGNVALVNVSAKLPPFARHGTQLDVHVASVGEATSLRGGRLLTTELRGVDGQVYALAAGALTIGGYEAKGQNARITRNHPTVGVVPGGAICEPPVEQLLPRVLNERGELAFILRQPSARTAVRAERAIDELLRRKNCGFARLQDDGQILVNLVPAYREADALTKLRADIEALQVHPALNARVVINESNGTMIIGRDVRISPCLVQVNDLTIEVAEDEGVSQPLPGINRGRTEKVNRTTIRVSQETGKPAEFGGEASLEDLIRGLQALGIDGSQMMNVLLELHGAGYLHGEIVR